jgi:WD40 repeat protein
MAKKETEDMYCYDLDENPKKNEKIYIIPFKKFYLKIFKGDTYYLLDRYRYDVNTMMSLLDLNRINKLNEFYKDYPDGIEKVAFIEFLKKHLPCDYNDPMDETNLVYGLYKLFCEVDFNGDGHMQWEEFTQFIIDTVEGDKDAKVDKNEDKNAKLFDEKIMIKYKRYNISEKLNDNLTHKSDVINGVFLNKSDFIIFSEYGQKCIKIYSPKTGKNINSIDINDVLNDFKGPETLSSTKKLLLGNKKKGKKAVTNLVAPKTASFSILYLSHYQNIIALCLSDKRILFFYFVSNERIELIYEVHVPTLEKRIWYLPEHKMWVCSGSKLDKYSYYTLNQLDIEIKFKSKKFEYKINKTHPYSRHFCEKIPHKGEILDVIEISKPKMVVTACMDGKIRLMDVSDRDVVKVWNQHTLGVRSLDYNPLIDNAGYVLSVGFEYYINVYCTDLSIDEAFKGRLDGHSAPVISCKFLSQSYMAASVDEEGNVRIWDTRAKLCLQTIEFPKKNFVISGMLGLDKYNKFVVYGNKIIYYDAKYKEEDHITSSENTDENYPIKVEFNKYYQQFFVVSFKDVSVYNKDGNLFKVYSKLAKNEHFELEVKIKSFIFDDNYRKFYIGFSNGAILLFNAGNGSLIKPINETEVEKDGIQYFTYSHTKEVTSMYYYNDEDNNNENLILLSVSHDSLINVYNESNPEESEKLRSIKGGHTLKGKSLEIYCLDFSQQLAFFATGSSDSLVVVWNFELSKIEDILYLQNNNKNEKLNVYTVKFLDPYPLIAVGYSDGQFLIWGIKEINIRGKCLLRARNYSRVPKKKIEPVAIRCINTIVCEEGEDDVKKKLELYKYFDEESPFMNPDKPYTPPKIKVKDENKKEKKGGDEIYIIDEDNNLDVIPDKYKNEIIDKDINPDNYDLTVDNDNAFVQRYYIVLGDFNGNVKIMNILGLIKKYKIKAASKVHIKSSFNILKRDDVNVETILIHNIVPMTDKLLPKYTNLYINVLRKEFKAHNDEINSITVLLEPICFITCSKDKLVKIWNLDDECLGVISPFIKLNKNDPSIPKWNFRVDEEKLLEKEMDEVVGIFEKVGARRITRGSKEDREVENMRMVERESKRGDGRKMTVLLLAEKREGKTNTKEKESDKKNNDYFNEENAYGEGYEDYYGENKEEQIEGMINNDNMQKTGMNQMTIDAIKNMVKTKKK